MLLKKIFIIFVILFVFFLQVVILFVVNMKR